MNFLEKFYIKSCVAKAKIKTNVKSMLNVDDNTKAIYKKCFAITAMAALLFAVGYFILGNSFLATYTVDISEAENGFKDAFNAVYNATVSSASVIAVGLVSYNIVMIMTSKNQRRISDAFTWIKAIATTWVCIMCASVFIKMGIDLFTEMEGYEPVIHN